MTAFTDLLPLLLTALVAASVNGGLGYGFSSIAVPVALLVHSSRVLNPALVLLEVGINGCSLFANRRAIRSVLPRVWPMLIGAVPGVVLGSAVLAWASPGPLKLFTFAALLPLVLLQSAGLRRPIRNERSAALPAGAALGLIYGATTISGPPLALLFNNQGLTQGEFRAALALFRIVESTCAAAAYLALGLFSAETLRLSASLAPPVLIGLPVGFLLLRGVRAEPFRRACMGLDALLVAFGLAWSAVQLQLVSPAVAWSFFAVAIAAEAALILATWPRARAEAAT